MTQILAPGFASLHDAQRHFRAILTALSRPGVVVDLPPGLAAPPPISPAAAGILLTLTDPATRVALPETLGLRDWVAFHTGAKFAPSCDADFVLAPSPPDLATLQTGTEDEPETGATLILEIPAFDQGPKYRLAGPGIETECFVRLPLDQNFAAARAKIHKLNPRGVDILLCAGTQILGLPRSTFMEPADQWPT
jgi:alpha-D-ribose 1-methylphosphonate 5-triphosphate synthase subunit PhnH